MERHRFRKPLPRRWEKLDSQPGPRRAVVARPIPRPVVQAAVVSQPARATQVGPQQNLRGLYLRRGQVRQGLRNVWDWLKYQGVAYPLSLSCLILTMVLIGVVWHSQQYSYQLDDQAAQLVGTSAAIPSKSLKQGHDGYTITAATPEANSLELGSDGAGYSANLPLNAQKGISVTDPQTKLSLTLAPLFKTAPAKFSHGRLIYPLKNSAHAQMVYTIKNNGIEENLVLTKAWGRDKASFEYQLKIPSSLEARPMAGGAIGIYSASPYLFGNINYGSSGDAERVARARQNAQKNHLMFIIPAPVIKQTGPGILPTAHFVLRGNKLAVLITGLKKAGYPLTIDPSLALGSLSTDQNFGTGNNEDNISFATANQISSTGFTGGTVGSWSTGGNTFTNKRHGACSVVYNNRIYVLGGYDGSSFYNDIQYSAISTANGTLGTFSTASTSFTTPRAFFACGAYNGYLYVMGGCSATACTSGANQLSDIKYAPISQVDGNLGSWASSSNSFSLTRSGLSSAIVNGYMYILGGNNNGTEKADSQYAALKPDGSLGTFASSASFTTARERQATVVNNGYIYIIGGYDGSAAKSDVQYAHVKTDGTLNSWASTGSFSNARYELAAFANGGYLYVAGGYDGTNARSDVQYATFNSDGTVGPWYATTSLASVTRLPAYASNNGYLYALGGCNTGCASGSSNQYDTINIVKPDSLGTISSVNRSTINNFTTARFGAATTTYAGYIYVVGGCANSQASCDAGNNIKSDTLYAKINTDGTLGDCGSGSGNWCDDTTDLLPNTGANACNSAANQGRWGGAAVAYDGNLYYAGGTAKNGTLTCNQTVGVTDVVSIQLGSVNDTGGAPTGGWSAPGGNLFGGGSTGAGSFNSAVVWQGWLYVIGGSNDGTGYVNTIRYAQLNQDGTVGTFDPNGASTSFTTAREGAGAVISRGYLYIIGGNNSAGTPLSDVQYIKMPPTGGVLSAANGSASSFTSTTAIPATRTKMAVSEANGVIYVAGGYDSSNNGSNKIYYGTASSTGGVSTWNDASSTISPGVSLGTARGGAGAAYVNGYMYVPGGSASTGSTSDLASTEWFQINNSGPGSVSKIKDTGASGNSAGAYATTRTSATMVALNGFLYVVGGCASWSGGAATCATLQTDTQVAKLSPDGSLTKPSNGASGFDVVTATLSSGRQYPMLAAWQGTLYLLGGQNATSTNLTDAFYAIPSTSTGDFSSWSTLSVTLPSNYLAPSYIQNGQYFYLLTTNATKLTMLTLPASGGNFGGTGTFSNSSNDIGQNAGESTLAINGNYMYHLGGANGTAPSAAVEYSLISSTNGTLSAWSRATSLPILVAGSRAYVSHGYLHAIGGWNKGTSGGFASNCYGHDWSAPLYSDGTIGNWSMNAIVQDSAPAVNTAARGYSTNGNTYMMPGVCGNNYDTLRDTNVYFLKTMSAPRVSHFSKLFDADFDVTPTKMVTYGSGNATLTESFYSSLSATNSLGKVTNLYSLITQGLNTWTPLDSGGSNTTYARYLYIYYMIDESTSYSFGGTPMSITRLDNYYHPYTAKRLHGGKTFTGQIQSSLDASP